MDYQFTAKMQAALVHYANDINRNKVDAYRAAYDCSNMQDKTVAVKAWELFKHPLMSQAVEQMQSTAAAAVTIDAAWVLERAARLANFNINRFIRKQDDGTAVYDFSKATDDDWYCIDEYTTDTIGKGKGKDIIEVDRVKLKTVSKLAALKLVGDHVGVQAFKQNVVVDAAVALTTLDADQFKAYRREMLNEDDC